MKRIYGTGALAATMCWATVGAMLITPAAASADTFEFLLSDHPNGALAAPSYGLRLDGMFDNAPGAPLGAAATCSVDYGDSEVNLTVDTVAETITIEGIMYCGVDDGNNYGFGEGYYSIGMIYNVNVEAVADGWVVEPPGTNAAENSGWLKSLIPGFDYLVDFYDYNPGGTSFLLKSDGWRLGGGDTWVGRGWLSYLPNHENSPKTQDWLFIATPNDDPGPPDPPVCTPQSTYDLGPAQGYNAFVCGDYTGGVDIGGTVAVGGNASFEGFSVGTASDATDVLVVGGTLWARDGTISGNAITGGAADVDDTVSFLEDGVLSTGTPIDFGAVCGTLRGTCNTLSALPATGKTTIKPWGAIKMTGTSPHLNVFEIYGGELVAANELRIEVPEGSQVLVNITGSYIVMGNFGIFLSGVVQEDVIFTACGATNVDLGSIGFTGSLLAPDAAVSFTNGAFHGTVVAGSLTGAGEFYNFPFTGPLDYQICPPEPDDAQPYCSYTYTVATSWPGGFQAYGVVRYGHEPEISGWNANFAFTGTPEPTIDPLANWGATFTQAGASVTMTSLPYNETLNKGETVDFGFVAAGIADAPTGVSLNGFNCVED